MQHICEWFPILLPGKIPCLFVETARCTALIHNRIYLCVDILYVKGNVAVLISEWATMYNLLTWCKSAW